MSGLGTATSEKRFAAYMEGLAGVIGHADQRAPLRDYCVGLMTYGGRKSVEPMAAVTAPERTPPPKAAGGVLYATAAS